MADWGGGNDMGLVMVYAQGLGDVWILQDTLEHPMPTIDGLSMAGDQFGTKVAISGDTIAVWAPKTNVPGRGGLTDDSGSVEMFEPDVFGWSSSQSIYDPDRIIGAMAFDGDVLVAPGSTLLHIPVTRVFERVGGVWLLIDNLPSLSNLGVDGMTIMGLPTAGDYRTVMKQDVVPTRLIWIATTMVFPMAKKSPLVLTHSMPTLMMMG